MKKPILSIILLALGMQAFSQTGVSINSDGSDPDASAILDLKSSDKGMLVPRMTSANRTAISSPADGLLVFDTDSSAFFYYTGSAWGKVANQYQLGGSSDYAEFEYDGTLVFNGEATTYEDLQIPGYSTAKKGTADPILVDFAGNVLAYAFNPDNDREVFFSVQLPHSMKEGSVIYPHVHYSILATPNANDSIVWALDYSWANVNGTFPSTATTLSVTASAGSPYDHKVIGFEGLTPTSGQNKISSILMCRFYRDANNAKDTFGDDAIFLQFDIHYEKNTEGSREQWTK